MSGVADDASLQSGIVSAADSGADQSVPENKEKPVDAAPFVKLSENPDEAHQQALHHVANQQFQQGPQLPPFPFLLPPFACNFTRFFALHYASIFSY